MNADDGVRNEFPDAKLFKIIEAVVDESVTGEDKWMTDMHQFWSARLPLEELS